MILKLPVSNADDTRMQVSVITTVYNEAGQIGAVLDSLLEQSRQPDEIVVVDGGSRDGTWQVLQDYDEEYDSVKAIQEDCNIAEGRNIAIEAAAHDIILGIDGGCIADKDWVNEMLDPFKDGADAVAGNFEPRSSSRFEYVQGMIVTSSYDADALERGDRAPSSRSIGFRRRVWEAAGGYPEDLYTGEDTRFNANVQAAGYSFTPAPDAVVYWHMRPTWRSLWGQYERYGEGDARAKNLLDHPSTVAGVPKNLLLLGTQFGSVLALAGSLFMPQIVVFFLLGILAPYGYHLPQLFAVVRERGVMTIPYWTGIVTVKTWGYSTGFLKAGFRQLF